jgi:hypothetical protein
MTAFPLLAVARVSSSSIGDDLGHSTAAEAESAGKTIGMLPLLSPSEKETKGGLGQLWRFLLGEDGGYQLTPLKQDALKPETLVLQQVKQENVEQRLAIGSNDFTLARFAIPSQSHLKGTLLSGKIFDLAPAQVALSAVYLGDEGDPVTILRQGLGNDRAWNIGTDARMFSDRLQLHGEYAWTQHNDIPLAVILPQDGSAYNLQLSYQPLRAVSFFNAPLNWTMGVRNRQVGRFFQSPAGPAGNPGMLLLESLTHLDWQGLILDASVIQENDNIGSGVSRPLHRAQVRGQYQFSKLKLPWWLGIPSVGMNFSKENNKILEKQASIAELKAGFSCQNWDLNLSHRFNWSENEAIKARSEYFGVTIAQANFRLFNNSLSLAPVLRYQRPSANFDLSRQISVGVGTRAVFIPEWLDGQLQVNAQEDGNRERLKHIYSTSGDLNWWLTPRERTQIPAIRIFLEARYQAVMDQTDNLRDYRIFLGVALD